MTSNHTAASVMKTSLLAGIVGAGIALLIAPRSGKDTRQKIHDNALKMQSRASEKLSTTKGNIQSTIDQTSDKLTNVKKDMQSNRQAKSESPLSTDNDDK